MQFYINELWKNLYSEFNSPICYYCNEPG